MDRHERLIRRMRGRDVEARSTQADLRIDRPDPPPEPLRCERCDEETSADLIECLYGDYWLCPTCAKQHISMAAFARHQDGYPGTDDDPLRQSKRGK